MRQELQTIMGLCTWHSLPEAHLAAVLAAGPSKLQKAWDALKRKREPLTPEQKVRWAPLCDQSIVHSFNRGK